MFRKITVLAFAGILGLAACGDTDIERGVSGAAIGAVAATVVDGDAFTGAVIGGAAGVLCDDVSPQNCR